MPRTCLFHPRTWHSQTIGHVCDSLHPRLLCTHHGRCHTGPRWLDVRYTLLQLPPPITATATAVTASATAAAAAAAAASANANATVTPAAASTSIGTSTSTS